MSSQPESGAERYPLRSSRAFRWGLFVAVAVIMAIGIVLMFLLTQATGNRDLYERTNRALIQQDWPSMDAYADAKTDVVEEIKARARRSRG